MLIFSNKFYEIWIGDKVKIPFALSFMLLIYFSTITYGGVFNMFINGVGKLKLQMYSAFIAVIIFLLGAYVLIDYLQMGITGLIMAMILSNFYGIIIAPIQYYKIINHKAKGIWNE